MPSAVQYRNKANGCGVWLTQLFEIVHFVQLASAVSNLCSVVLIFRKRLSYQQFMLALTCSCYDLMLTKYHLSPEHFLKRRFFLPPLKLVSRSFFPMLSMNYAMMHGRTDDACIYRLKKHIWSKFSESDKYQIMVSSKTQWENGTYEEQVGSEYRFVPICNTLLQITPVSNNAFNIVITLINHHMCEGKMNCTIVMQNTPGEKKVSKRHQSSIIDSENV